MLFSAKAIPKKFMAIFGINGQSVGRRKGKWLCHVKHISEVLTYIEA